MGSSWKLIGFGKPRSRETHRSQSILRFLRVDKAMGSEGSFSWEGERKERGEERRGGCVGTRDCV